MTPEKPPKDDQSAKPKGRPAQDADPLGKRDTPEAGNKSQKKRTIGNHPADPNRTGADWNLLPPGISDEDAKNPGGMTSDKKDKK